MSTKVSINGAFTRDKGFQGMNSNSITFTLATMQASMTIGTLPVTQSAQIEVVTSEDPFFLHVNLPLPKQPRCLSFNLQPFKVTENTSKFGVTMDNNEEHGPSFITEVIRNLKDFNGKVEGDRFDEPIDALEFQQRDKLQSQSVRLLLYSSWYKREDGNQTPTPVSVFSRLFQKTHSKFQYQHNI
jgi:hypothetical protein